MINEEITLRKLEILVAFVESGHLGRTAEAMQLSTVSVHRALHSLEQGMRCALFKHEGRNLKPLPSALTLAESAKDMLRDLERGIQKAREKAGFGAQQMKIGAMYSLTVDLIPKLVMGVKLRRPELNIELTLGSNAELLLKLENQDLDALVMSLPEDSLPSGLAAVSIFRDDIFLASPAASPEPPGDRADLADYRDAKFVALAGGFATSRSFDDAFALAGFTPEVVMRVGDIFSLMNLVAGGIGHTLLPGRVRNLFEGRIRFTPLAPRYQHQQIIGLIFPENRERDPNLLALLAEARMLGR
jgi:LysR family malonate utilization transcriptional regulator